MEQPTGCGIEEVCYMLNTAHRPLSIARRLPFTLLTPLLLAAFAPQAEATASPVRSAAYSRGMPVAVAAGAPQTIPVTRVLAEAAAVGAVGLT
jgi:hypothetical protein